MNFIWDRAKATSNRRKHEVAFEEACTVFLDALSFTGADPDHSIDEERWLTFGRSVNGRLLGIAHRSRRYCPHHQRPSLHRSRAETL